MDYALWARKRVPHGDDQDIWLGDHLPRAVAERLAANLNEEFGGYDMFFYYDEA